MKKLVLIAMLSSISFSLQARWIVHKVDEGPNGFSGVSEYESGGDHQLSCANPGQNACKWKFQQAPYNEEEVDLQIADLIASGIFYGNFTTSSGRNGEFTYDEANKTLEYIIY